MSVHAIDQDQAHAIRQVLMDVRDAMSALDTDACDVDDVQEVMDKAIEELEAARPNVATLGTYLNSIARSLRSEPRARTVVLELDAVMRDSHVPTNWEH
jgi:translation initiation factor 2B subunit (eIF-2B alpha/beta/delta family)